MMTIAALFGCVPRMFDNLAVQVLYPTCRMRRGSKAPGRRRSADFLAAIRTGG